MKEKKTPKSSRRGVKLGQGRETTLRRRKAYRNSALTVLVLTNGVKTEKQYFDALRRRAWGNPFHVSIKNCAPTALVEFGMSEKSNAGYDQVWCVCDVDAFDVREAVQLARECGIGLALSQPCFEVWLILHKKDFRKSAHHAKEVEAELSRVLPRWDKSTLRMEDFWEGMEDAIRRAKALGEPPKNNPSTAVWEVMEVLRASPEEVSSL